MLPLKLCSVILLVGSLIITWSCGQRGRLTKADEKEPNNARFISRVAAEKPLHAAILAGKMQSWAAFGAQRAVPSDSAKSLLIAYYSPPAPGQPIMQLQLLAADGRNGMPEYVDPVVLADLDSEQAELVMTNGVPRELVNAMVSAANTNGWKATSHENVRRIYLDASEFFPQE